MKKPVSKKTIDEQGKQVPIMFCIIFPTEEPVHRLFFGRVAIQSLNLNLILDQAI